MDNTNKEDLKTLETRLDVIDLQIDDNDEKMSNCTVSEYVELRRRNNELFIKKMAIEDTIDRLINKNFSKNKPEHQYSVASINPNRYQK